MKMFISAAEFIDDVIDVTNLCFYDRRCYVRCSYVVKLTDLAVLLDFARNLQLGENMTSRRFSEQINFMKRTFLAFLEITNAYYRPQPHMRDQSL